MWVTYLGTHLATKNVGTYTLALRTYCDCPHFALTCLFPFSTTTKSNLHKNLFGSPPHRGAILLSNNTVSFCLIDMAFLHLLVCNYVKSFKTLLLKHVQLDETIFQSKKNKK